MTLHDYRPALDHADRNVLRAVQDGAITWSEDLGSWYDNEHILLGPCTNELAARLNALTFDGFIIRTGIRVPHSPLRRCVILTIPGEMALR